MPESYYPQVEISFIKDQVEASQRLEDDGIVSVGSTTFFVLKGVQAIFKRRVTVRELEPGLICLEEAVSVALRFHFLGALTHWLEVNRNWKEGEYTLTDTQP